MKFKGTDNEGSFKAWGIGLGYDYDAKNKKLDIAHAGSVTPLLAVDFDDPMSKRPDIFVRILEKTTQIKALVYSNNTTINLAETLDRQRLPPILQSAGMLARYGFDLEEENFLRFAELFARDFSLKSIGLHKVASATSNGPEIHYDAQLETRLSNEVKVRATTLPALLLALSDQIIRDVITLEFGYGQQNTAHLLLSMTSKLSELSFILNDRFVPSRKILNTREEAKNPF